MYAMQYAIGLPAEVVDDLTREFLGSAGPTTVRRVTAVDVTTWTVLFADLDAGPPAPADGIRAYEVLHVSTGPRR